MSNEKVEKLTPEFQQLIQEAEQARGTALKTPIGSHGYIASFDGGRDSEVRMCEGGLPQSVDIVYKDLNNDKVPTRFQLIAECPGSCAGSGFKLIGYKWV